ncbi:dnaJ homolog subfamily C member 25 homolog isoform X2 [Crassostrea angulata]|uniref:dnaJ homolog subfamily C member 25 homolog isoform X2 n=1 Tax=Magallana gigas TaxID=29159 RepID=UPI0005C3BDAE|nr:dnaJ homolog subfamily C member 25 homolog isoform X2 [Crassostrea gigas]XP_052716888.1 dnaJ homolog subfamily C member 25 homolog isoform X2 [Crassostrea angulata]|eukprot:XP_011437249.1 PREDICTED: dnaJ homolog subfamily C member 25 homolog isoform X2 [Crassostrea gigas]
MAHICETKMLIFLFLLVSPSYGFLDGLYCGLENCYEILGVTRDASRGEITKGYRKLARKWHPDMASKAEENEEFTKMFQKIANAYEILRDDEQRENYNYMLDNPDEHLANYYRYYRRYAPKVDIRIVIAVTLTIISVIQYWGAWNNYNAAINYLCKEPKYRIQAVGIAKAEGLIGQKRDRKDKRTKEEIRNEEEEIIKKVIEEKMDIRGGYSKPNIKDILWIQLILSPYYLVQYIIWFGRWVWKFWICREEYGEEEKLYLIKKYLKASRSQWELAKEENFDEYMRKELWIKENFNEWKREKEEEMKAKLAESARYKSFRRYMKKGGPGQMSFGPE